MPFDAEDVAELAVQHRQELPADLRGLVPHLPTRAARLVHKCWPKSHYVGHCARDVVDRLAALEIETFAERFACSGAETTWLKRRPLAAIAQIEQVDRMRDPQSFRLGPRASRAICNRQPALAVTTARAPVEGCCRACGG